MNRIHIETAQNGYVVEETQLHTASTPYVFETFENLVKWLDQNLAKPAVNSVNLVNPVTPP